MTRLPRAPLRQDQLLYKSSIEKSKSDGTASSLCLSKTNAEDPAIFEFNMSILTIVCSRNNLQALLVFALLVSLGSCTQDPWAVDTDHVELSTPWKPLDLMAVLSTLPEDSTQASEFYAQQTGQFGAIYVEDILRIGPSESPTTAFELRNFVNHTEVQPISQAIDSISGTAASKSAHSKTLQHAFKRFHAHFPDDSIPQLVWMNSGFNHAVFPTPQHLGIGLEWFLGAGHPLVQTLPTHMFPAYQRERMEPNRIAATAMRGWLLVHFSDPWYAPKTCADEMLFWGKSLFILEQLMPNTPRRLLMDWTASDWNWALENERQVWVEMQPQGELFETNRQKFGRWFNEGPFTRAASIPQESPDRLGAWIGWNAVSDYMNEHPETSLSDLMQTTDPLPVLKAYRPDR